MNHEERKDDAIYIERLLIILMHPISDMLKYEYNVGLGMDKL